MVEKLHVHVVFSHVIDSWLGESSQRMDFGYAFLPKRYELWLCNRGLSMLDFSSYISPAVVRFSWSTNVSPVVLSTSFSFIPFPAHAFYLRPFFFIMRANTPPIPLMPASPRTALVK